MLMTHDARSPQPPSEGSPQQGAGPRGRRVHAQVVEVLQNGLYALEPHHVEAGAGRPRVVGHLSGAMRVQAVRLRPGDQVHIELSPLDPAKARILGRAGLGRADTTPGGTPGDGL